ncbi:MAG: hypothetical protein RIM72_07025 [Alphaproteobacteria bacterium]
MADWPEHLLTVGSTGSMNSNALRRTEVQPKVCNLVDSVFGPICVTMKGRGSENIWSVFVGDLLRRLMSFNPEQAGK